MSKRKNRKNRLWKVILLILSLILICLLFFAFKDNLVSNDNNNFDSEKYNESINTSNKKNKDKIEKKNSKTQVDNSEPKKDEKSEVKQEIQNNVSYTIELIGDEEITINVGDKYNELGAKAKDSNGNDASSKISIDSNVDTSTKGEYMVIYSIGKSMVIRTVIVK